MPKKTRLAVATAVDSWSAVAKELDVGKEARRRIQKAIASCLARLG